MSIVGDPPQRFATRKQMLLIIIFIVLSFLLSLQLRPMPIAVGACSNATKTTQKYDTAPSEYNDDAFQEKWPSIKAKLCPNSIPSYQQFGRILFDLARDELGLKKFPGVGDIGLRNFWEFMPNGGTAFLKDSSDGTTNVGDLNNPQNQYKSFLHVPIWKCANNDVRENLNKTIPHSTQVKFLSHGKLESWLKYIGGSKNVRHSCIVVVVRDPISHFLSGYNEYECRLNNEIGTELKKKQKWVGNPVNFERFVFGTEARFEQFVVDFLNGPNRDQLFDYWSNLYHMYSLTGVLTKLNKLYRRKLTGYLPSVNDLENNYPSFLNETCPGVLPKSAYEPWKKEDRVFHESEADELGFRSAANAVWGNGGRTARALCLIHTIDYACYDKIPVPVFCRDVYLSEPFSNGLNRTNIKRKATPI